VARKKERTPEEFWGDYENQIGEQVLARSLGRYLSGWDEFDRSGEGPLWGLLIVTGGGFRFHHFPQVSWLDALTRFNSGGESPREKTFFIPRHKIDSAELRIETSIWKRIFIPHPPLLAIHYRNEAGLERELLAEADSKAAGLAEQLSLQP
jgi:hypothetical protein